MSTKIKTSKRPAVPAAAASIPGTDIARLIRDIQADRLTLEQLFSAVEVFQQRQDSAAVYSLYENWIAKSSSPQKPIACFNFGVLLAADNQLDKSIEYYRLAVSLAPAFSQPRINLGLLFERQGKVAEAIAEWRTINDDATIRDASPVEVRTLALNHIGRVLEQLHDYGPAEVALKQSLEINPHQEDALHHWVHLRQRQCKWPVLGEVPGVTKNAMLRAMSPLAMLAYSDDPGLQLLAAENILKRKFNFAPKNLSEGRRYHHKKLRIAYLSGDLCTHAVGLLMPEVLENHDRSKFDIYAFDYSREDGTALRQRFKTMFTHFESIAQLTDEQVAQRILDCEIDILIDMHGLSLGARPGILALRPAPVQVTYIGYIGTTGMPWIDYVIADPYSLPKSLEPYFSERPIYLDTSCLPGDSQREVAPDMTRAQIGLPEDKFIFASFNNSYKLNSEMFGCWMKILKASPNAVLWMVDDNPWATENLRSFARNAGVSEDRIIFTKRVAIAEYRARMKLADLFLDNHPYNAGSTASDVVWAGLPMLTLSGQTFVSRMAGGLLNHAGVTELITTSYDEYIDKAIGFANDPATLQPVRQKLTDYKQTRGKHFALEFIRSLERELERCFQQKISGTEEYAWPDTSHASQVIRQRPAEPPVSVAPAVPTKEKKILIEGWRNIYHSYAMVNQNQILELAKYPNLKLYHRDLPFIFEHWKDQKGEDGFNPAERQTIDALADCRNEEVDLVYKIASPYQPVTPGVRNVSFMVAEIGLDEEAFLGRQYDVASYTRDDNVVMTPSRWSRDRLLEFGLEESHVKIIPHGVRSDIFKPMSADERANVRKILNIAPDELVILNVGVATWNKGIDALLMAAAVLVQNGRKVRLILKNNKALYGIGIESLIETLSKERPQLFNERFLSSLLLVQTAMNATQLNSLYAAADVYVSAYRAEGFNLPVLEAMSAGLPVVVTDGGSTDDFFNPSFGQKISAKLTPMNKSGIEGKYLEPSIEHLIDILQRFDPKAYDAYRSSYALRAFIESYSWHSVVRKMVPELLA